jgi:Cof subfamily protein (haloacid dehalogenase superfamily)
MTTTINKKKTGSIKLIAIDLDGTLLNSDHKMTEGNQTALKAAMAQGVKVVLATGKTRHSATTLIERLGLDTPGIYVQGLVISYPDGTERHLGTLDPAFLRRLVTFVEERGFIPMMYSGRRLIARHETIEAAELTQQYDEPLPEFVGPLQNMLDDLPINKVMFAGNGAKAITALRWQLAQMLDGKGRLVQALPEALELLPIGASKGTALRLLLKDLGIEPGEVLAIGDGENDIEMIQMAGVGVAMGNASEKLKAVANAIVTDNDHDGVAEAVYQFVIKDAAQAEPAAVTMGDSKERKS